MSQVKYEGKKVKLAGKEYVIPHLNFKARRNPEIEKLTREFFQEQIRILEASKKGDEELSSAVIDAPFVGRYLPIVHAALVRNYPELTLEELDEALELDDVPEFMSAMIWALNRGDKAGDLAEGGAPAVAA